MGAAFPQLRRRRVSSDPPAVPRRRKAARLAIDAPQLHMHEPHGPIAARRFGYADGLAAHGLAHKNQVALPPNLARVL